MKVRTGLIFRIAMQFAHINMWRLRIPVPVSANPWSALRQILARHDFFPIRPRLNSRFDIVLCDNGNGGTAWHRPTRSQQNSLAQTHDAGTIALETTGTNYKATIHLEKRYVASAADTINSRKSQTYIPYMVLSKIHCLVACTALNRLQFNQRNPMDKIKLFIRPTPISSNACTDQGGTFK
jgi:hypothetical protein